MSRLNLVLVAWVLTTANVSAHALRDPTRPPSHQVSAVVRYSAATPELSTIMFSEQRKIAIIDGQMLRPGEKKAGIELLKLSPGAALIRLENGQTLELLLSSGKVHKEVK